MGASFPVLGGLQDLPMKFNIVGNEDCLNPMEEGLFFFLINCCNNVLQASGGVSYFFWDSIKHQSSWRTTLMLCEFYHFANTDMALGSTTPSELLIIHINFSCKSYHGK